MGFDATVCVVAIRRVLIAGTLNQWMALGSQIGSYNMQGASSGHASADSKALWALRVAGEGDDLRVIRFEEINRDERPPKIGKLKFGKRYA